MQLYKVLCVMGAIAVFGIAYARDHCSAFKARLGVFAPQSSLFRSIYGKVEPIVDLEISRSWTEHIDMWANLDFLYKRGRSLGFCSPTRVIMSRLSAGIKCPYHVTSCTALYIGAGLCFGGLWLKNDSLLCCEKVFQGSVGITTKSGVLFSVCEQGIIDLFFDYGYQPTRFCQRRVNTGGAKIGIGGGFTF